MRRMATLKLAVSALALGLAGLPASAFAQDGAAAQALIPTEVFTLDNGLRVVMNIDRSDPVVSVGLVAHVGSGREVSGRTGFAHMFEHLFFLDSENLGPGGLDKLSARVGGSGANGYTNTDHTVYLQTVPKDALEKMLWAEADKLGYFINTVTPAVVAKEIQVVKNEKRQSYDNQPYGQSWIILSRELYPEGHPYSWSTIGSLADLDAATLDDVKQFYRRWYVPNNSSLILSGDFDPAQARIWVEKYFGELPRGAETGIPEPRPAALETTKTLTFLDDYARLPRLTLAWPTVVTGAPDDAAIALLFDALTDEAGGPVYKSLVEEAKLSSEFGGGDVHRQMAGFAMMTATAFADTSLDAVHAAIQKGFADFAANGVSDEQLARYKTLREASLYRQIASVGGKTRMLAESETMGRRTDLVDRTLAQLQAVTAEDVMRVYKTYIEGKPRVELGIVPKDQPELAMASATLTDVPREKIVQGAEAAVDQTAGRTTIERTPSSFDRTIEPDYGDKPVVTAPDIWTATLANGMGVSGIVDTEIPVVSFELSLDGGQLRDDSAKPGVAALAMNMLERGTAVRDKQAFATALKSLGSNINVSVQDDRTIISGSTLARNFAATMKLVDEMITMPRWDPNELALLKDATVNALQASLARPNSIANLVAKDALYGGTILEHDPRGTVAGIKAATLADLKAFHASQISPANARLRVVGPVDAAEVKRAAAPLAAHWTGEALAPAPTIKPAPIDETRLLFYDVPNARQSAILFMRPGPGRAERAYFDGTSANFILGGGGFASRLTQEIREGKGYAYNVGSGFSTGKDSGTFFVTSPVRANVTLEAATLMRDIIRDYGETFTEADLVLTKGSLSKARARAFETQGNKLGLLGLIGDYDLPADYIARENDWLDALDMATVRGISDEYFDTDEMLIVVVGDAKTQAARLEALGYGKPEMVKPFD